MVLGSPKNEQTNKKANVQYTHKPHKYILVQSFGEQFGVILQNKNVHPIM